MNTAKKFSRYLSLLVLVAAAVAGPTQAPANPLTIVRFQMDGKVDANAVPYLVAQAKGYFAQEGLEVSITRGAGASATVTRLAAGHADMGQGDMPSVIDYAANNPSTPVHAVFLMYETSLAAMSAYVDKGVLMHGNAILANTEFSRRHPAAVSGFLRAMARAVKDVYADRAEGMRILDLYAPLAEASIEQARLDRMLDKQVDTAATRANGIGAIDVARLQKSADLLASELAFESAPDVARLVDTSFMPARAERLLSRN